LIGSKPSDAFSQTERRALSTLFDTDDEPAGQRFRRWRETSCELFVPVDVASTAPDTFRYQSLRSTIGGLNLGTSLARQFSVVRDRGHIARSAQAPFSLYVPTGGQMGVTQNGRSSLVRPGEFVLIDQDLPYEMDIQGEFGFVWVHIPHAELAQRIDDVSSIGGTAYSMRNPYADLAASFLGDVARVADRIDDTHGARIAEHVLDLIALAMTNEGAPSAPAECLQRKALLHRARAYIDQNLRDAALSLERVAAAIGTSSRSLSGFFTDTGTPYRTYLREQRLQHCACDLVAARSAHHSITEIALSWGFADSAHFSRVFRARYGVSPSDYRALSQMHANALHAEQGEDDIPSIPGSDRMEEPEQFELDPDGRLRIQSSALAGLDKSVS
jgi:AraC-like DNA-binding protein